ncbi:putative nuclease HARBI1 [Eriocheir sinensis]|uniref:putative nuclease HARBI1 n=1 Tax=Eriocheir sinensis TaxID=95602 RepID=UPI0021CAC3AE|nr:putative nuclease HARBI1 [Eriocheir sinensis]
MALLWALEHDRLRRERVFRDRLNPLEVSDDLLLHYYRLPRHEILQLCEEIGPHIHRPTSRTRAIPIHTQILVALRFYASGTFQNVVGDVAGISQSSISRILNDVTEALLNKAKREINMPQNLQELMLIKQDFYGLSGFPSVIGAIDCTHIPIKAPANAVVYLNRKRKYSLNVQVVADSKMRIISFCASFPGSVHDSYIWRQSVLRQQFVEGQYGDSLLLGDSGYPLEPFLMTPVSQPTTDAHRAYNRSHSRTRVVVEQTFGVLKSRFRCLHGSGGSLQYDPVKCAKIAIACMLLHNICIIRRIQLNEPLVQEIENMENDAYRGNEVTGQARRRGLIDNVFS